MTIRLVIECENDRLETAQQELDQSLITFGRSKSCHIELDNPEVSRRHFIIKFVEGDYILLDEQSRHGTILDGEKLEPLKAYPLGSEHEIVVPGFSIRLFCDGQKPKFERTTVVARKLLDELLQNEVEPREVPFLMTKDESRTFNFVEEKTSFVLGSLLQADFVIEDEGVQKKHLTFARDINGIRLIPLLGNQVFVNGAIVKEPQILSHGALIKVGDTELIFNEYIQKQLEDPKELLAKSVDSEIEQQNDPDFPIFREQPFKKTTKKLLLDWKTLDRFFLLAFLLVLAGASALFFELI